MNLLDLSWFLLYHNYIYYKYIYINISLYIIVLILQFLASTFSQLSRGSLILMRWVGMPRNIVSTSIASEASMHEKSWRGFWKNKRQRKPQKHWSKQHSNVSDGHMAEDGSHEDFFPGFRSHYPLIWEFEVMTYWSYNSVFANKRSVHFGHYCAWPQARCVSFLNC